MEQGTRPGGLTAMAVLNFVFGGLAAMSLLMTLVMVFVKSKVDNPQIKEALAQLPEGPALIAMLVLGTAAATLMIVSGVGYLKQRRVMGRHMGNLYALVDLTNVGITLTWAPQGFKLLSMIGIIYPVLTLILVNTTFRDDLRN